MKCMKYRVKTSTFWIFKQNLEFKWISYEFQVSKEILCWHLYFECFDIEGKFIGKVLKTSFIHCFICYFRGVAQANSRESPSTFFTVEDEVEKTLYRKKSFFKKASKSSILTVI